MEKKKLQVWLPLLFSITMIAGMFIGYKLRDKMPGKSFFYMEKRRTIQEVMDLIQSRYVDTLNLNNLNDTAIAAVLAKLDPHSIYIPARDLQMANDDIAGNFYGIGVEFNILEDTIHVINVLKDGPSFAAGLKTGDMILKADDSTVSGRKISSNEVRRLLRGPKGSEVNLLLLRQGKKINATVKRGIIPLSSVDAAYMITKTTGYIRLNKFSQQTYREFMTNLLELKKQGLKELILDLRGNGGGVLDEAVEIADEFLDGDKLVTYTEGAHIPRKEYRCRRTGQFETGKLILLADEGSASASEILLGAMQDWDRATIIGRRSFGKGLVQEQYDLSNKAALRLTVARYYTPLGRSIQRPYDHGGKAYYAEITDRFENGGILSADSLRNDSSKIFVTKGGKTIFGSGGISPDYFVPADTSQPGLTSAKLYFKGIFADYGYRYFLAHPDLSSKYSTAHSFVSNFSVGLPEWQLLQQLAAKDSIQVSAVSEKERAYIYRSLKTSIARQLFRNEGYFEAENIMDPSVQKALTVIAQ